MSKRVDITFNDKMYENLKRDADNMGIKVTEYIRKAVEVYFILRQRRKNVGK